MSDDVLASAPAAKGEVETSGVIGLLGRKLKMTQIYDDHGRIQPVTVIEVGPCTVLQVKQQGGDGYRALQLGFGSKRVKRIAKPQRAHYARAGYGDSGPEFVREVSFEGDAPCSAGDKLTVKMFDACQVVDIIGTSKGRGFAGTIRRHNFQRGPETHGSKNVRDRGSNGSNMTPGRTYPNKRMAGHMGDVRVTARNLRVLKVDTERNLLLVGGSVPGPTGGFVIINKATIGG
jgi:large subunit ribosomal protein L3